jgi:hypothetical protein
VEKRNEKREEWKRVESGKEKRVKKSREWKREKNETYFSHTAGCIKSWKLDGRELE